MIISSPICKSLNTCISPETRADSPSSTRTVMVHMSGITIGRFDSACGAIGTNTMPFVCGCNIGPFEDKAYAVEPVGVAIIKPSARCRYIYVSSTCTCTSIIPVPVERLTTMSFKANSVHTVFCFRTTCVASKLLSSVV